MARPLPKARNRIAEYAVMSLVLFVGILAVLPVGGLRVGASHTSSETPGSPHSDLRASSASAHSLLAPTDAPRLVAAPSWWNITTLSAAMPAPRILGTMVWDPADNYSVLFGGASGTSAGEFGDTWSFRNGTWTQLSPSIHPLPRAFQAMAWDPIDNKVLLFGGFNGTAIYGDTWAFSHGQWTNISPLSSPPARYAAGLTYDGADGEMLLYGGVNASLFAQSDTWAFAHGTWSQLSPATNPGPLVVPAMVYDAADGYVLLEGGSHNDTNLGVTGACWRFSGDVWTQLTPSTLPAPRLAGMVEYDPETASVLLLGGANKTNAAYSDFWQFHAGAWNEIATSTPLGARFGSAVAYQPLAHYLLLTGGELQFNATHVIPTSDSWAYASALNVTGTALPPTTDLGAKVRFSGQSAGGIGPVALSWSFGDASSASGAAPNHTYVAMGSYTVHLNATDALGVHATTMFTVSVNARPTAAITTSPSPANVTVSAGGRVNFTGTAAGGTAPFTFGWSFGDGLTGTGNRTSHAYAAAGTFTVRLTLTDAAGVVAISNASVNVTAGTTHTPPGSGGSSSSTPYLLYGILAAVVVAVAVAAALLLSRRKRSPPTNPAGPPGYPQPPYYPPPSAVGAPPPPSPPPPTA
ncbi:MAG: PKD domain-containing protein [Thermoplasmata archaeon]|nr:PKD domain-containing protein [Thermoplasmata archaeon]